MKISVVTIIFPFFCCLVSCKTDPKELVESYITTTSQYDKNAINKVLSKDVIIYNNPFTDNKRIDIDSFMSIGGKVRLMKISSQDDTVTTTESWTSTYDSLLDVTPQLILYNTYHIKEGHINSIRVNRVDNLAQYKEKQKGKANSFNYYLDYEYPELNLTERKTRLISLLTKYNQLSNSERKEYNIRAYLKDSKFISTNNWVKMGLKFKGRSAVSMSAMGFTFPSTYTIDEDQIMINPISGATPMPLTIKDDNTMVGESVQGDYIFKRVEK